MNSLIAPPFPEENSNDTWLKMKPGYLQIWETDILIKSLFIAMLIYF